MRNQLNSMILRRFLPMRNWPLGHGNLRLGALLPVWRRTLFAKMGDDPLNSSPGLIGSFLSMFGVGKKK